METPSPASQTPPAPRKLKAGFTLVELLVVIGIIALLIAILLPALSKARQAANTAACSANLHTMGQALMLYINQSRHYPGAQSALDGGGVAFGIWAPRLRNMMDGNQKVFWCPATEVSHQWNSQENTGPVATLAHDGWGYNVGEHVLQVDSKQFSYGYNDWGTVDPYQDPYVGLGGDCWTSNAKKWREPNASVVKRSAECIIITDSRARATGSGKWLMNVDPRNPDEGPADLHSGGSNVLFCDGHVVRMPLEQIVCYDVKTFALQPVNSRQYQQVSPIWNTDNLVH